MFKHPESTIQLIIKSIHKLDLWIENNGWAGYDPYDIKGNKLIQQLIDKGNKYRFWEIIREIILEIIKSFPMFFNHLFRVKKKVNPKGMALFASAYIDLYTTTNDKSYYEKSKSCIDWLLNNKSSDIKGIGWGYPFNWQSKELIPKFTPNGIVTTAAGEAFWKWYKITNDEKYLNICKKIGDFLITLPQDKIDDDQLCFSYTPLFINHVHNLNLFVAEFLLKVGIEVNDQNWIETAQKAINYTINNQLTSGAFDYNGPPEKSKNFTDNYHTCFVLRMLHSIWKLTDNHTVYNSLEKCYQHYINNFFVDRTIPKLLPERTYRIDIHSCAESINCLIELGTTFPEGKKIAQNVTVWTIKNLQSPKGYFYYGILKSRFTGIIYKSKIAYMRWGQAWMMRALSRFLKTCISSGIK